MTKIKTISWDGASGAEYKYYIYPIGTDFSATPANYIYAKETEPGRYRPIYVGETGDLSDRPLDTHHKKGCIERQGATHIHVHKSSSSKEERVWEEADIVDKWNPHCNG